MIDRILNILKQRGDASAVSAARPQLRMLLRFQDAFTAGIDEIPEGYQLVPYTPKHDAAWISVLNLSGEFGKWDKSVLRREILSIMIEGGGVLAERNGTLIGCATACYAKRFSPYALLSYVLVLPDHRGLGLGRTLSAATISIIRKAGYPGVILQTDDNRIPAIRSYLRLGFEPCLGIDAASDARWRKVLEHVG